jgi:predicted ATPase
MFRSVRLQNFFSFADETVALNPGLNLLVGINGSGKSNLLNAFRLLYEGLKPGGLPKLMQEWGGFDEVAFAGGKAQADRIEMDNLRSGCAKASPRPLRPFVRMRTLSIDCF